MIRFAASLPALCLLVPFSSAAENTEITIEKRPFFIRHAFEASALPEAFALLELKADAWTEFEIIRIAPHGSRVTKGEPLVSFDPQNIDRKIHDTRQSVESKTLEIAQAALDLKQLEETTPHRQAAHERAAAEAKKENTYFTTVRRKAEEETADQKLKRAEMFLESQREELRQLKKMYEADDLTEETEEIILKRQQDRVEAAEFDFRMQQLTRQRTHEVLLPREAVKLAEAERDAAIALAKFLDEAPRAIARKKLELDHLNTALTREKETLAKLEADRLQFEFTAPADGWFYHGAIENGRWAPGDAAKTLVSGGRPAVRRPFATFIAADVPLKLAASLDGAVAAQLAADAGGEAWLPGREDAGFPVKLSSLSAAPGADGKIRAEFAAQWPAGLAVAPASNVSIHLLAYESPQAMVLPLGAVELGAAGWTVELKLADGKTERRPVQRGRISNNECEILSGLESGQVVIVPPAK